MGPGRAPVNGERVNRLRVGFTADGARVPEFEPG